MPMTITRYHAQRVVEIVDAGLCRGLGRPVPGFMCVEAAVCMALGLEHGDDPPCVETILRVFKVEFNDDSWGSNATRAAGLRRLAVAQLGSKGVLDAGQFVQLLCAAFVCQLLPIAARALAGLGVSEQQSQRLLAAVADCEAGTGGPAAVYGAVGDVLERPIADRSPQTRATAMEVFEAAANLQELRRWCNNNQLGLAAGLVLLPPPSQHGSTLAWTVRQTAKAMEYAASHRDPAYGLMVPNKVAGDRVRKLAAELAVQVLIECRAPGCEWLDLCPVTDSEHAAS